MATPRLLANKITGDLRSPLTSLLKKQQFLNYNYKCGRHASLSVFTTRKFQTKSLLKSVYNLEFNLKKLCINNYAKLFEDPNSLFCRAICLLSLPNSPYNVLYSSGLNRDGRSSSDNDDSNAKKPEVPGDPLTNTIKFFAMIMLLWFLLPSRVEGNAHETSWPVFLRLMLQAGEVKGLTVSSSKDKVYVYLHSGTIINGLEVFGSGPHYFFTINNVKTFEEKLKDAQEKLGIKPSEFIPVKYLQPKSGVQRELSNVAVSVGILALFAWLFYYSGRKGGALGSGLGNPFTSHTRAKATIILPGTRKGINFKDVAGMQEAKLEVNEFVDYLKDPARFKELGAKIPKGALLCGPPGTGKTLLAKAVSNEAAVPFLAMAGSDFVETFSGVGSARVRDLFAQARKNAPCIVYIDEVDAIGKSRKSSTISGGNSEQESTLNQLLVEMDGMNSVEGIIMLASTNRPDVLDNALLRPGRFDRNITIDLPTLPERNEIFKLYLKQLKLGDEPLQQYAKRLAELTPGKSGADIANICNEAALHAARLENKVVEGQNFEYAIERVIAGIQKNSNPLSPEERRTVAYHEAGHVIVSWMLQHAEPVLKISTIPRTHSALGFIQKFPLDIKLHTNEQLFDMMCSLLGGRVAESLVFDRITTGAEDDLKKVTDMVYKQIVFFGMNKRIGPLSFPEKRKGELSKKPYSDKLAHEIDEEASLTVAEAHKVAQQILTENIDKLHILAEALLEKEVLNYDDIVSLIGQSPHGDKLKNYYSTSNQLYEAGDTGFKSDPTPA